MNTSNTKTSNHAKKIRTMKRLPIFLLLSILCLSSCGKFRCTVIEGHILEYGSDKPIANARIPILKAYISGPIQGGTYPIDTVYTDASGYFKWESDEDPGKDWYVIGKITADQYFRLDWKANGDYHQSIYYKDHYKENIYLDPHAYLHLHVEDVPEVEGSFCRFGGSMISTAFELKGGEFIDTFLIRGNRDDYNYISYLFSNAGPFYKDTIFTEAHDTLHYHLKY